MGFIKMKTRELLKFYDLVKLKDLTEPIRKNFKWKSGDGKVYKNVSKMEINHLMNTVCFIFNNKIKNSFIDIYIKQRYNRKINADDFLKILWSYSNKISFSYFVFFIIEIEERFSNSELKLNIREDTYSKYIDVRNSFLNLIKNN